LQHAVHILKLNRTVVHKIIEDKPPLAYYLQVANRQNTYTWLFISPSGISELDCTTTKKDTAEKSISIGRY